MEAEVTAGCGVSGDLVRVDRRSVKKLAQQWRNGEGSGGERSWSRLRHTFLFRLAQEFGTTLAALSFFGQRVAREVMELTPSRQADGEGQCGRALPSPDTKETVGGPSEDRWRTV